MNKKKLLEKYNQNYCSQEFYNSMVTYAFSESQLKEGMKKLGAKQKDELTTLGFGSICLKSKANEIIEWILKKQAEKDNWLKNLTIREKEVIIRYEIDNHECTYTNDIEPVLEIFNGIFELNLIISIWTEVQAEYQEK